MKLGAYEFEWVPDELDIPRPEKTTAVQRNHGGVGFFSWGPLFIGKKIVLKWNFVSRAQYDALKAMHLAGGTHILDLSSETIYIAPPAGSFVQYPDPSYPGVLPGPPWKRFYIGPVYNGPWWANAPTYFNFSAAAGSPAIIWSRERAISVADPANSYIDVGPKEPGNSFPDYRVGDTIWDNSGGGGAVIIPWEPSIRPYYLYTPVDAADKIYYDQVKRYYTGTPDVLKVGDDCYVYTDGGLGYDRITELGEDSIGKWFKRVPYSGSWELVPWAAGEFAECNDVVDAHQKSFVVMPWQTIPGGAFGGG